MKIGPFNCGMCFGVAVEAAWEAFIPVTSKELLAIAVVFIILSIYCRTKY